MSMYLPLRIPGVPSRQVTQVRAEPLMEGLIYLLL